MSDSENQTLLIGIEAEALEGKKVLADILEEVRGFFPLLAISAVFRLDSEADKRSAKREKLTLVIKSEADVTPEEICKKVLAAEANARLKHPMRWFKIYLLAVDQIVAMNPSLVLPHPALVQSEGFLAAGAELWGRFCHPVLQKNLETLSISLGVSKAEFVSQGKSLLTENRKLSLLVE